MIDVILPLAPSINSTNAGRKHTKALTEWKAHAGWLLKVAKLKPIVGAYSFRMEVPEHSGDIDGRIKHTMDLFTPATPRSPYGLGLTADDRHCVDLHVVKLPIAGKTCRVVINEARI